MPSSEKAQRWPRRREASGSDMSESSQPDAPPQNAGGSSGHAATWVAQPWPNPWATQPLSADTATNQASSRSAQHRGACGEYCVSPASAEAREESFTVSRSSSCRTCQTDHSVLPSSSAWATHRGEGWPASSAKPTGASQSTRLKCSPASMLRYTSDMTCPFTTPPATTKRKQFVDTTAHWAWERRPKGAAGFMRDHVRPNVSEAQTSWSIVLLPSPPTTYSTMPRRPPRFVPAAAPKFARPHHRAPVQGTSRHEMPRSSENQRQFTGRLRTVTPPSTRSTARAPDPRPVPTHSAL
mmetsp:Transcript_15508/g.42828  ORF Transcript_15508/g.42828 Transcript_15508/m.42828 type:complete len:296 (-) Transcript_15508:170-1057(-)